MKKILFLLLIVPLSVFAQSEAPRFADELTSTDNEFFAQRVPSANERYRITLHFDQNRYGKTEPIEMEIRIHCAKDAVVFTNAFTPFRNYSFRLYDQNNNQVEHSYNYALWHDNDRVEANTGDRIIHLKEGESYSYRVNLRDWFAIDSGKFRIQGAFNPTPAYTDAQSFTIPTVVAYFSADQAHNAARTKSSFAVEGVFSNIAPSTAPPYDVVETTLIAMQRKDWEMFFRNMHLPSIITLSDRYRARYAERFGGNYDSFSDTGASVKWDESFSNFLRSYFPDDIEFERMRREYGEAGAQGLAEAFKTRTMTTLALRYELEYRTAQTKDKKSVLDEFKKYFVSQYDIGVRERFLYDMEKKYQSAATEADKTYYRALIDDLRKERGDNLYFDLASFTIVRTTVEEWYGIPTATVLVDLREHYEEHYRADHIASVRRVYTLRKLGEYWYIVNYSDSVR